MSPFKTAEYGHHKKVVYVIFGGKCVFMGLDFAPSTINAVEDILLAIMIEEGTTALEFYDLQTCAGYRSKAPGTFEYDQVIFELRNGLPTNAKWRPADCPQEIRTIFDPYISGQMPL